jgi:hypothetical protein
METKSEDKVNKSHTNNENIYNNVTFFQKTKNFFYSLIFDLPFDNYHNYYKTGIIQKMSEEDIRNLLERKKSESQHKKYFSFLVSLRPNILDDQDMMDLKEFNYKMNYYYAFVIGGLLINWAYFSYNFILYKRPLYKRLICINLLCFLAYVKVDSFKQQHYERLYEKYKHIVKKDELQIILKKTYNID